MKNEKKGRKTSSFSSRITFGTTTVSTSTWNGSLASLKFLARTHDNERVASNPTRAAIRDNDRLISQRLTSPTHGVHRPPPPSGIHRAKCYAQGEGPARYIHRAKCYAQEEGPACPPPTLQSMVQRCLLIPRLPAVLSGQETSSPLDQCAMRVHPRNPGLMKPNFEIAAMQTQQLMASTQRSPLRLPPAINRSRVPGVGPVPNKPSAGLGCTAVRTWCPENVLSAKAAGKLSGAIGLYGRAYRHKLMKINLTLTSRLPPPPPPPPPSIVLLHAWLGK